MPIGSGPEAASKALVPGFGEDAVIPDGAPVDFGGLPDVLVL
jgi:hypothetical protein